MKLKKWYYIMEEFTSVSKIYIVVAECRVTEYSEWSVCSVTCGKGLRMRQRKYLNEAKAAMLGCDRQLVSKEMCVAAVPECL
jgi:hypothetical protein